MKIKCDVCEKVEADVLCCADEAVLCKGCDVKVHAANKLSLKHQRVSLIRDSSSLSSSSTSNTQLPFCDICQERKAYFFCLEDRALLCRQCDVSRHSTSPLVSSHQRYLIGGIKLALESFNNEADSANSSSQYSKSMKGDIEAKDDVSAGKSTAFSSDYELGNENEWPFDEILGATEFDYCGYCGIDQDE